MMRSISITSLLGIVKSWNRGTHMRYTRWVLECLLIAGKYHYRSSGLQSNKKLFSHGHQLLVEKMLKDFGNNVYNHQPKVDRSLGDTHCWYYLPHTLCHLESYNLLFWELLCKPVYESDFLKGVEGFCLAGCICLCNLSIAWSLAHSKSSQHVSDWKSVAFGKSPWLLIIISALRQLMS